MVAEEIMLTTSVAGFGRSTKRFDVVVGSIGAAWRLAVVSAVRVLVVLVNGTVTVTVPLQCLQVRWQP